MLIADRVTRPLWTFTSISRADVTYQDGTGERGNYALGQFDIAEANLARIANVCARLERAVFHRHRLYAARRDHMGGVRKTVARLQRDRHGAAPRSMAT